MALATLTGNGRRASGEGGGGLQTLISVPHTEAPRFGGSSPAVEAVSLSVTSPGLGVRDLGDQHRAAAGSWASHFPFPGLSFPIGKMKL